MSTPKFFLSTVLSVLCLTVLAFDVSAGEVQQKGTHLKIQFGKDASDARLARQISVEGTGLGEVSVTMWSETPVTVSQFSNVRNISVKGSPLEDSLWIDDTVEIAGNLTIKSGAGDDEIYVSGTYHKNVKVSLGDGDDSHYEDGNFLVVGGSYSVKAGKGKDQLDWDQHITVGKSMSLHAGAPEAGSASGEWDVSLGGGYTYTIGNKLSITLTKRGGQIAELEGVSANLLSVRGGKGEDTLDLSEGGNSFGKTKFKKVETILTP
jgi:hypothetical protein